LQAFLDAPLRIDTIEEHGDEREAYGRRIVARSPRHVGVVCPSVLPGEGGPGAVAAAGIANGAALKQWSRNEGHESIKKAAASKARPTAARRRRLACFNKER
jgi:hypothetical protein